MELIKIATGEPITREQIEAAQAALGLELALPYDLTGVDLSGFGAVVPERAALPETSPGQIAELDGFEQYAPGKWRQKYKVRNRTAAELAAAKEAKKDEIRALRWDKEIGGATFNGTPTRTDEGSRAKINGAVALFDKDPTMIVVDFEAQPGAWIALDQPTMEALGVFVGRHVQQCFSHSKPPFSLSLAL